jgi:3-oxoacyl-[acyl-carrier-protein] synthase-1
MPKFTELGMRSQVAGVPEIDVEARIDRKQLRFMGDAAAYAQIALEDAIAQAGLTPEQVSHPRTGLIMGSGGGSPANQIEAADTLREKGIRRVGPYQVTRCMSSTVSACLATNFKVKGINYSITSACSTSAHCIGAAAQQIAWGMQDVMFAGGGEELSWGMALLFDGMGAMSSKYNDQPEKASRAYDANRDGFVIAGGGGAVVLESLEHAQARGARILAEVVGFGATSDGEDMVAPSGDGAIACMQQALEGIEGGVDYINTHARGRQAGSACHAHAVRRPGAAVLLHQVADRPFAGRHRRAGSHLLHDHDGQGLHRGLGQRGHTRPGPGRHAPGHPHARCATEHRAVQQLRLRRHQRLAGAAPLAGSMNRARPRCVKGVS